MTSQAGSVWSEAIAWLEAHYEDFTFFAERDVVWTVQCFLTERLRDCGMPYRVFNDHPILPGPRRSISCDLAIVGQDGTVELAAELKYEPSHSRADILAGKLPVVFWGKEGVGKDVARISEFVARGVAKEGYAVFVDEGGYFRKRAAHPGSQWIQWSSGPWILISHVVRRAEVQ